MYSWSIQRGLAFLVVVFCEGANWSRVLMTAALKLVRYSFRVVVGLDSTEVKDWERLEEKEV